MGPLGVGVARGSDKALVPLETLAAYDLAAGTIGVTNPVAQAYALLRDGSPEVPDLEHAAHHHDLFATVEAAAGEGRTVPVA